MSADDPKDLIDRFWKNLAKGRTGMLGLAGSGDARAQPMTAHFEGADGPIYFYAHKDSPLSDGGIAAFHWVDSDHDLFASVRGELSVDSDPAVRARFWSEEVARWFPRGQDDPDLALLRFDPVDADLWRPSGGWAPGIFNFGRQPPKDIRAQVTL